MVSGEVGSKAVEETSKLLALIWEVAKGLEDTVDGKGGCKQRFLASKGQKCSV